MNQGTCLLCFSVTKVFNIKYTHLQNVYEELSGIEIQADPHPLCYICYTKLLQSQQLLKQIQENSRASQPDLRPLIQLSMVANYAWSLPQNSAKIQLHPVTIKEENIKEEYVEGTAAVEIVESPGRESKSPAIKEECAESPSHYEAESTGESAYEHIPTEPTQDDTKLYDYIKEEDVEGTAAVEFVESSGRESKSPAIKEECAESPSHYEAESTGQPAYEHIPTKPTQDDTKLYDYIKEEYVEGTAVEYVESPGRESKSSAIKEECAESPSHYEAESTGQPAYEHIPTKPTQDDTKLYDCNVCNKTFISTRFLKIHHRQFHPNLKPYKCDVCSKDFRLKCLLNRHIQIHTIEKPYSCDVCSKTFREKGHLNSHILIHSNVKPYSCDVCSKTFRQKGNLIRHILTHANEKLYSCDVCSKTFRRKGTLNNHILIHSNEKPYGCDVCSKSFHQKGFLNKHILIHATEKP